ncbi:hypothetical protein EGK47_07790 [Enterococcus faecium]|nr:hypothetical protein EGK47_07790 [Enterococcus faecium]
MLGNNVTGFYPLPVTKTLEPLSPLGLSSNGYLLRRCYHVLRIKEESKCSILFQQTKHRTFNIQMKWIGF